MAESAADDSAECVGVTAALITCTALIVPHSGHVGPLSPGLGTQPMKDAMPALHTNATAMPTAQNMGWMDSLESICILLPFDRAAAGDTRADTGSAGNRHAQCATCSPRRNILPAG